MTLTTPESQIRDALADLLRSQGFTAHAEVYCRDQDARAGAKDKVRLDLLVLPPAGYHLPFSSIGIEVKNLINNHGHEAVEPVFQVKQYMRAFCFKSKEGILLPRPQVVLLALSSLLKDKRSRDGMTTTERFLWKAGGALLFFDRWKKTLRFESNAANPMDEHYDLAVMTDDFQYVLSGVGHTPNQDALPAAAGDECPF